MKNVLNLTLVLSLFLGVSKANADCRPAYGDYLKNVSTFRSTAISSSLTQSSIMLSSYFVSDGSRVGIVLNKLMNKRFYWVIFGVSAVTALMTQTPPEEARVKSIIDEAYLNQGSNLVQLSDSLKIQVSELSKIIVRLNETDALCTKTYKTSDKGPLVVISDLKGEKDLTKLIQDHRLVN